MHQRCLLFRVCLFDNAKVAATIRVRTMQMAHYTQFARRRFVGPEEHLDPATNALAIRVRVFAARSDSDRHATIHAVKA
jgi:hypothetical protein